MNRSPALLSLLLLTASLLPIVDGALPKVSAADKPAAEGGQPHAVKFRKIVLDSKFRSEGVAVGDFNHDGKLDIAAGNVYYTGPDWKMVAMRDAPRDFPPKGYSDSFANFAADINGDGWTDLIVVDLPGKQTFWFENPGADGGPWQPRMVTPVTNNESPLYVDMDGKGVRSLIAATGPDADHPDDPRRQMAILRPGKDLLKAWDAQPVSAPAASSTTRFSHGLGVGDINGDGRLDILVPQGWWEAPEKTTEKSTKRPWKFHNAPLGEPCAQMAVYDFDGDGRNDVVSSSAHAYGLWWHRQLANGWRTQQIDHRFSQSHALCLADLNGDGRPDLVTGKRWWAHTHGDPGINEPAVLYWYELQRVATEPRWTPHLIDSDSGVGTQFEVTDVNGDGLPDIAVANKKGVFLFLQVHD